MALYFLFSGRNYESYGGVDDLQGTFETLREAQEAFTWYKGLWAHGAVVEDGTLKIVGSISGKHWWVAPE